eukprot:tig00000145_g8849.t1
MEKSELRSQKILAERQEASIRALLKQLDSCGENLGYGSLLLSYHSEVQKLKEDLRSLFSSLEEAQKDRAKLAAEQLDAAREQHSAEVERLQAALEEAQESLEYNLEKLQATEEARRAAEEARWAAEAGVQAAEEAKRAAEARARGAEESARAAEEAVRVAEEARRAAEADVRAAEDAVRAAEAGRAEAEARAREGEAELARELEAARARHLAELGGLQASLKKAEEDNGKLQRAFRSFEEQEAQERADAEKRHRDRLDALARHVDQLERSKAGVEAAAAEAERAAERERACRRQAEEERDRARGEAIALKRAALADATRREAEAGAKAEGALKAALAKQKEAEEAARGAAERARAEAEKERQKQAAAVSAASSSSSPAAAASGDGPKIRALRNASRKLVQTIVKQLRPVGSKASKPIEIEVDRAAVVESALRSCLEQRLLEQLRQPAAPLKIAMECAEDRKGPSREFYALFFEELVKNQLLEEPMQGAQGVLPPAAPEGQLQQRRRKRTVIVDSEDEDERCGEDGGSSSQGEKRARLEGGQPSASTAGSAGGQRRSGRSSSQHVAAAIDSALLTKYRFIGAVVGRALLGRILDSKGTDPIPAAFVSMLPLLAGKQPDACATAEEALALWEPFLDPQVHGSMARILAEPVSPEAPVPMDPYLQGCPAFSGEELTEANKRDLVRLAAQWQCVGRRQPLLEAMREGFQGVFTRPEASKRGPEAAAGAADALEAVGLLGADDWAALVGGQAWTAETLIANMRFHGDWRNFEEDRALVERWLFDALRAGEVDPSQFARCIGRASAPASGKLERPLTIAPKTNTVKDGAGRKRAVLVPWSDKEWGLAFRTCFDEVEIPGAPSGAAGAEEERRRLFMRAVRSSVEDLALDFNDG